MIRYVEIAVLEVIVYIIAYTSKDRGVDIQLSEKWSRLLFFTRKIDTCSIASALMTFSMEIMFVFTVIMAVISLKTGQEYYRSIHGIFFFVILLNAGITSAAEARWGNDGIGGKVFLYAMAIIVIAFSIFCIVLGIREMVIGIYLQ